MSRQYLDQYEAPFTYFHQATATGTISTVLNSSSGTLFAITVNTKGATSAPMTVYDNTAASGTIIGVIDTTQQVQTLFFQCAYKTGLTINLAPGTNAGPDITVLYV